jgi:D-glycero-D-manno-heptose 1,7-bisphosphate phosphatase
LKKMVGIVFEIMDEETLKAAIFLDRDGVLTIERGYICKIDEVELFPYASECINCIHEKGYVAIVITNQSGVARGLFQEEELQALHDRIIKATGVDAIYYCPHYIKGIVSRYSISCNCRKPNIGLIERAQKDFEIDLKKSYMVGDRATDIQTGRNAGLRTVLLESGYGSGDLNQQIQADYTVKDLKVFIDMILGAK